MQKLLHSDKLQSRTDHSMEIFNKWGQVAEGFFRGLQNIKNVLVIQSCRHSKIIRMAKLEVQVVQEQPEQAQNEKKL